MSDGQQEKRSSRVTAVPVGKTPPPADKQFRPKPGWGEGGSYALPRPGRGLPAGERAAVVPEPVSEVGVPSRRDALYPRRSRSPESTPLPNVRREGSPAALPGRSGGLPASGRGGSLPSVGARQPEPVEVEPVVPSSFVESGDWGEQETAVEAELERGRKYWSGGSGFRVTQRDVEILRFLGRYRYAQSSQVARFVQTSPKAAQIRLSKMGKVGLVRREDVTQGQSVWTPTAGGLAVADLDVRVIGEGQISYVTMAHTLGLVNIGIELELGGANLLAEPGWPFLNRVGSDGEPVQGERVLTEREISSGQRRWKKEKDRGQLRSEVSAALRQWEAAGDLSVTSPELLPGNEGMFVLYSTAQATLSGAGEHVPDMVIARPRAADGSPQSIAVELELAPKPSAEWKRILRAFANSEMFGRLVYFTHKASIAEALTKINAEDVGMPPERFAVRKYVPVSTLR